MEHISFLERNQELYDRYGHLLEGVNHFSGNAKMNEYEQNKMLIIIDNLVKDRCAKHHVDYKTVNLKDEAVTNTVTGGIATLVTQELPMVRKVFPNMISRELCSIQTIQQPNAKIFYRDIQRSDSTSVSANIDARRTYADNVEYDENAPQAIAKIKLVLTDADIVATEKKLKAQWTSESAQDLMAYHGMNAENELTGELGAEIVREWDRVLINAMINGATGGTATFDQSVPAGLGYEERKYWMETLYEKFIDVDNAIFKKRYRRTNFMVVPADQSAFIDKMAGFRADSTSVDQKIISTGGRYFMGTLNSRWRVYVDPFLTGTILLGYNNPGSWVDTAFVFCPYILSFFSDTFLDPNTFLNTRAILSRAAYKVVVPDLLGTVTITGS